MLDALEPLEALEALEVDALPKRVYHDSVIEAGSPGRGRPSQAESARRPAAGRPGES
jgi:hypothetical protein